jgi:hypothetical protein
MGLAMFVTLKLAAKDGTGYNQLHLLVGERWEFIHGSFDHIFDGLDLVGSLSVFVVGIEVHDTAKYVMMIKTT